jgi:hypothetical protein
MVMAATVNGPPPLFVSVSGDGALVAPTFTRPRPIVAALRLTTVPVPVSETVCGLPAALSVIVRTPVTTPRPVGLK